MDGPYDVAGLFDQYYKGHEYFKNFPFDARRYIDRIDRLRKAIGKLKVWADYDEQALKSDRILCPPQEKSVRGVPRWQGSEAERLLKLAIDEEVHLKPDYKPKTLWESNHGEYKKFPLGVFRKHVRQEIHSRKTFDEKTRGKRREGYKVGRYGDKTMRRQTDTTNTSEATAAI